MVVQRSPRKAMNSLQDVHIAVDCSGLALTRLDRRMYAESTRATTPEMMEIHRNR
jgi:hypothetical protein